MGNTNSIPEEASKQQQQEQVEIPKIIEPTSSNSSINSSDSIKKKQLNPIEQSPPQPPQPETSQQQQQHTHWSPNEPSIQEGIVSETPAKAVPVSTGKSGWVSSTGGASPWYNSLSSSSSSSHHQHRASISGPYYRTRGMSVSRESEGDEDLTNIGSSHIHPQPSTSNTNTPTTTNTNTTTTTTANTQPIVVHNNNGVPTIITWTQGGHNVYVTGTFNGWKHKIKLVKSTHDFSVVLELPPGTHRLKFIVDDEWKCSNDMETATDPDGNLVNYLLVMDEEEDTNNDEFDVSTVSSVESLSTSADDKKYSNVIPPQLLQLASMLNENNQQELDDHQKKSILEWEKKQPQPPTLPPHLDKVLLNSQTVSEEDNSVLHEPNHVTLNHLYACSIKDNVMALATTSRYRKKYVTTMYYRPVFPKQ